MVVMASLTCLAPLATLVRILLPLLPHLLLFHALDLTAALPGPQEPAAPPFQPLQRTYFETVCKPPTLRAADALAPCVSIEVTEALCHPNGTTALHLEAHAQCLCQGSFFPDWSACRSCLSLHGFIADADRSFYQTVAGAASAALCAFFTDPAAQAPTATFAALFRSVEAALPGRPAAATALVGTAALDASGPGPGDRAPSQTAVSLYYTVGDGPQGPGPITGAAATAVAATGLQLATGVPTVPTAAAPPAESAAAMPAFNTTTFAGTAAVSSTLPVSSGSGAARSWVPCWRYVAISLGMGAVLV